MTKVGWGGGGSIEKWACHATEAKRTHTHTHTFTHIRIQCHDRKSIEVYPSRHPVTRDRIYQRNPSYTPSISVFPALPTHFVCFYLLPCLSMYAFRFVSQSPFMLLLSLKLRLVGPLPTGSLTDGAWKFIYTPRRSSSTLFFAVVAKTE